MRKDAGYQRRAAALLRSAANDLKRDDFTAARDLGMPADLFRRYANGELPIDWELIMRAARVWPLNERDLLPHHDDVPEGVLVHTAEESVASARILRRRGADYYEYRDTVMSRRASYRPERIRMLRVVHDVDPINPGIEWNDGHLLYQFTYFVGPVNYYYQSEGRAYCAPMNTGDSVWGVPFAPHSFAARSADEDAYILALTYGGCLLGDAQRELAVLGPDAAADLALPTGSPAQAQAFLLRSLLAARLLPQAEAARLTSIRENRLKALCDGAAEADWRELNALAHALRVSIGDLLPRVTEATRGVSIQHYDSAAKWAYPDSEHAAYRVVRLAGDPFHPDTTAFELEVLAAAGPGDHNTVVTHQHSYFYVLGGRAVMSWKHHGKSHERELISGDSIYAAPTVPIAFARSGSESAKLVVMRIGSAVTTDVRWALGGLVGPHMRRYLSEDQLWYRPEGRHW